MNDEVFLYKDSFADICSAVIGSFPKPAVFSGQNKITLYSVFRSFRS